MQPRVPCRATVRPRRPLHAKPLIGAAFALASTHFIGLGGLVSTHLEGYPASESLGWLLWSGTGLIASITLCWADLGLLWLADERRPERYRRAWRWVWITAPLAGSASGVGLALAVTP